MVQFKKQLSAQLARLRWTVFVASSLFLPLPTMAFCSVPQPRLVCAEYFASQLVVEATLIQTRELHSKEDPESISAFVYTLRTERILRGSAIGTIRVYEGNDSGRATFDWVRGREYLLFLFQGTTKKSWELDGCGNSTPLSRAKAALAEIAEIKAAHGGGVIHGAVSEEALSTPAPGVHIEAIGSAGHYETTTNERGEFQIDVPAGRYVVRAVKTGVAFGKADISYADPRQIRIEPGGCAQVQLVRVGSK